MSAPYGPVRTARLRRIALTLTLLGLLAALPVAVGSLGADPPREGGEGLAVVAAAAFAAAGILFLATGHVAGLVVALPAIAIGALLDDPATMGVAVIFAAPAAEVAAVAATRGYPEPLVVAWRRVSGDLRAATARALEGTPLRRPPAGTWVLDRLAAGSAIAAAAAILVWGSLVAAFGSGDDPMTRTVIASATEFAGVLGVGLGFAVASALLCVLTGRVPGVLMALPVLPAVWLDAPQRSEVVVVVIAAACGLAAVLATPVPAPVARPPG